MSKDRTERVELTVLCLLCRGDEVLLQNRLDPDWGGYCMPGGHVEPGESFVDAVKREMLEETGLAVSRLRLCGVKHFPIRGGRYLVLLFRALEYSGTLRSSEEGGMEWVRRADIPGLRTVPEFEQMLRLFDEEELSEFVYQEDGEDWKVQLKG